MKDYRLSRKTNKGSLRNVLRNMHALSVASPRVIDGGVILKQQPDNNGRRGPMLQLHMRNVSDKIRQLKGDQRWIQQTQSARRVIKDRCWQSVMWHGITTTPDTKTFVQTFDDGRMQTWDEAMI